MYPSAPPVVRATPSDWGARIRPTALRSFLPKPESETSLSSVVTSAGGDTKDPDCGYTSFVTSAGGETKDPYCEYTSVVTSAGGQTKDSYCGYTSFVTSAGGQTNHSPQSEGVARTTGGERRRPLIDPLWVGLENQHLGSDLPRGEVVMRGVAIGSPSRSGYALRLGARIRPTELRSFLPKPEETVA